MKFRATDSFYTSETKQVHANQQFTAEDFHLSDAKISELKDKGLITPVKAEASPKNKADQPPANKAQPAPQNK
jgi:hypothetical protein